MAVHSEMVDFRGEQRGNATHESSTDPEARLMRRGNGQPAKLCYGGHTCMENRSGLCVDVLIADATAPEPAAAKVMVKRQRRKRVRPTTLGADKSYHTRDFVAWLRGCGIAPHIARIQMAAYLAATAYDLLRLSRLLPQPAT